METSRTFYKKLRELPAQTPVVVATIIRVRGSVPREIGTKMIIHPLGQHYGTVGGGCGEAEVIKTGLNVIDTGQPQTIEIDLTEEPNMDSGGVCGGIMDVYLERWLHTENPHLLDKLDTSVEKNQPVALLTVVQASEHHALVLGKKILITADTESNTLDLDILETQVIADARQALAEHHSRLLTYQSKSGTVQIFVEVLRRPPVLIIVGAGHVALPLARLGKMIDFEVVVLDDRPRFANAQRFPMADQVLAQPLRETLHDWPIDPDTFVVLVTRGHSHDVECLLEIINSPARYIGMIGSKRRIKAVFDLLEKEAGIDPVKFNRVYAPIGLDIGAENPAEIAISIVAEIVNIHRGGRATTLSDVLRADRRLPLHPGRLENK